MGEGPPWGDYKYWSGVDRRYSRFAWKRRLSRLALTLLILVVFFGSLYFGDFFTQSTLVLVSFVSAWCVFVAFALWLWDKAGDRWPKFPKLPQ